jgi:hypothetical protein
VHFRRTILTEMGACLQSRALTAALGLLFIFRATPFCAADPIGFVLAVNGSWEFAQPGAQNRKVSVGDGFPSGARIRSTTQQGDITIVFRDGKAAYCTPVASAPCESLKMTGLASSRFSQVLDAVLQLFQKEPLRFQSGAARGSRGLLQDAVVLLDKGRLDLRPAFRPRTAVEVKLQFVGSTGPDASEPDIVIRSGNSARLFSVTGTSIAPGLYRLRLLDPDSATSDPLDDEAYVLICTPSQNDSLTRLFGEARSMVRAWNPDAGKRSGDAFLRAYLVTLASRVRQ